MDTFYADLATVENFSDITDPGRYVAVPAEWYVVVADVKGSTEALLAGRYKQVNMVGAAVIVALLNIAGKIEIPFIFGGDGAILLIPPSLLAPAETALLGVQALARREFELDLRVGLVPVASLLAVHPLDVAKFKVSDNYVQAMFTGGGLLHAEELVKNPATAERYAVDDDGSGAEADLSGLECRWRDIASKYGETVSLLILATTGLPEDDNALYREVLSEIARCYGADADHHPIALDMLRPSFNPETLSFEAKLRSGPRPLRRQVYLGKIWLQNLLFKLFVVGRIVTGKTEWVLYPAMVQQTVDYKKFDDTLRMVISGTTRQRENLTRWLDGRYRAGELVYGLHTSDRAIMTCLVFERMGRQVHFVDGADGGYTLAARAMKKRLQASAQRQAEGAGQGSARQQV
jgi:hypothetical protein